MPISEAYIDFLAGWCSGAMGVLTCQPVDTVLTRWQAGNKQSATTVSSLWEQAGVRGFWRGSSAMIGAVPLQNALLMGGYGIGKQYSESLDRSGQLLSVFVGGCTGGLIQSIWMAPVELVKVQQQVVGLSAAAAGRQTLQGIATKQSWRGLNATFLRDGIPHGVWFASYEYSKEALTNLWVDPATSSSNQQQQHQVAVPLASGAIAATVAWGVGYPFDLIKTRIQAASSPMGILETGQQLIVEGNGRILSSLYKGFTLKLVRSVPASMIGFLTYEFVANSLRGTKI